jgi:hypothetical protein
MTGLIPVDEPRPGDSVSSVSPEDYYRARNLLTSVMAVEENRPNLSNATVRAPAAREASGLRPREKPQAKLWLRPNFARAKGGKRRVFNQSGPLRS